MSPPAYNRSRASGFSQRMLGIGAVAVGVLGTLGVLVATGVLKFPVPGQAVAPKSRPEGVAVPLAARPIPAFTQITREHLIDLKTMEFSVVYLPAEQVAQSGLLSFDKIVGRVVKSDHNAAYAFTEKDLLPKGTHPGPTAGVPPTKRMFVLEADKVIGVRGLQPGDSIDLLASMEVDQDKVLAGYRSKGISPALDEAQHPTGNLPRRAGVKPLVQGGVVVLPATTRHVTVPGSPIGADGKPKTRAVEEVTIAIDPKEVAPLTEALAIHATVFCVAHSGSPEEDHLAETPGSFPPPKVKVIETIVGGKRDILIFSSSGEGPIKASTRETPGPVAPPKDKQPPMSTPASPVE